MGTFTEELSFGPYKSGIWDEPPAYRTILLDAFDPAVLFAAGEQGFWYDPSDLSTVWQDSARTVPGAVDQPVGCIDDKSGRGNNATQATAASRPRLRQSGSLYYLEFDGIDDGLATGIVTPGIDEMQIISGVRKLSDAARGMVVEHSLSAANPGCYLLEAPSFATPDFRYGSGGTLPFTGVIQATGYAAPTTRVVTGLGDISARLAAIRVDGVQFTASLSDQGAGNYSAQNIHIGQRGSGVFRLNGYIYGLLVRFGANLVTDQLTEIEQWMAGKTGVTL